MAIQPMGFKEILKEIDYRIVLIFSPLLLQWVTLIKLGPVRVKFLAIAAVTVLSISIFDKKLISQVRHLLSQISFCFYWQFLYSFSYIISLYWSDIRISGLVFIVRQQSYFILSLTVGLIILRNYFAKPKGTVYSIYLGCFGAIVLLIGLVFSLPNGAKLILNLVTSTSLDKLEFSFRRFIFSIAALGDSADISFAARHDWVGYFILFAFLVKFCSTFQFHQVQPKLSLRVAEFIFYLFTGLITLFSVSRQSFAIAMLMLLVVAGMYGIRSLANNKIEIRQIILLAILVLSALFLAAWIYVQFEYIISIVYQRIFEDTTSYQERSSYNSFALDVIQENPFAGAGGRMVDSDEGPAHNYFLISWYQSGLPNFLCSLIVYLSLLGSWFFYITKFTFGRDQWRLPCNPEWILVLPIFPLCRAFIKPTGLSNLLDWIPVSIFAAFICLNRWQSLHEVRLQTQLRQKAAHPY